MIILPAIATEIPIAVFLSNSGSPGDELEDLEKSEEAMLKKIKVRGGAFW